MVAIAVGLIFLTSCRLLRGPTSAQVRLDTGDRRYCWFGVPLQYDTMPEPQRTKILSLKPSAVPEKWITYVYDPWSADHEESRRTEFNRIAYWVDEDPNIGRWALEDLADDIEQDRHALPASYFALFSGMAHVMDGKLVEDWRSDGVIRDYCLAHGYTCPPALEQLPGTRN